MLSNLLGNAVEHGQPGAPVAIHTESDGRMLTIRIHNFGAPIPPEELKVIFQPLVRAGVQERTKARPRRGLGLGLYIARRIAEAHGGRISATSEEGEGTTFVVTLQRRPTPAAEATADHAELMESCPLPGWSRSVDTAVRNQR
jgi:signal transduction histidine kinase